MVTVKPGNSASIDFIIDEEAKALGIPEGVEEAKAEGICEGIVVATRNSNTGTLSYLLRHTNVKEFVDWLTTHTTSQSKVYVVGGWPEASEDLLRSVRFELESNGLEITAEDTMSQNKYTRDVVMERSGAVTVEHYRMSRTPSGTMRRDTMWINYLVEPTECRE
ncbi:hypothetical protein HZB90_00915 [archaeon]|nr:hypothetical protein [archaeon]